jgi:hypothetical protein
LSLFLVYSFSRKFGAVTLKSELHYFITPNYILLAVSLKGLLFIIFTFLIHFSTIIANHAISVDIW